MRPLVAPVTVSFRCTMEAVAGDKAATYASATYQGASFLRPGERNHLLARPCPRVRRVEQAREGRAVPHRAARAGRVPG